MDKEIKCPICGQYFDVTEIKEDAIEEFAEWFDREYDIYQPSYDGGCKVKISTTLTRYFLQLKEQKND